MIKLIKVILYKILGFRNYIRLLYRLLAFLLDNGFMKKNPKYYLHQFSRRIIFPGDIVLDIGANLGYYTRLYQKLVGSNGKVFAVEPVVPFYENLQHFLGKKDNVVIWNYALGNRIGDVVLSVPKKYGYLRTGLPRVVNSNNNQLKEDYFIFQSKMTKGSLLFSEIKYLDYLKMDVEGYEMIIIPEIVDFLILTKPTIQVEISEKSKNIVEKTLLNIGYKAYYYYHNKKQPRLIKAKPKNYKQDFFFIHSEKKDKYKSLIE